MLFFKPYSWLSMTLLLITANCNAQSIDPITIVIGEDTSVVPSSVSWTDGVCYKPMTNGVHPGDTLEFRFFRHDVHQMASKEHFMSCNFTDATLLANVGESPFRYRIPAGQTDILYFACGVGDHCGSGTQKLQVMVASIPEDNKQERPATVSSYLIGTSTADCQKIQESPTEEIISDQQALSSECTDPVLGDNGYYTRTCLSGPATLTPGGVINRLFVLQYPFPKDHRVIVGQRDFEFVHDNIDDEGITPVPVNQLYVHHLSGNVVFGQGAEGLRQEAPDAPLAAPFARLSGDEGDAMTFHIIDLRQVDDWLACIECRCPVISDMTYLDDLTNTGNSTGGVNCCSNCTDLTGPTLDYRMRYNISYQELDDEEPIENVKQLVADISPAVGKTLEHDVPSWEYLPEDQRTQDNPYIQYLERVEPFNVLFKEGFFSRDYSGSPQVQLIRCVAHLHVAAIDMYLEDAETGERLCDGKTTYGKDPETDAGFLISVSVDNHDPPLTFPADRMVRFVARYDATHLHTGVMGYWFVFIDGEDSLTRTQVDLTADICLQPTCDTSMLPVINMEPFQLPPISNTATRLRQVDNNNSDNCVNTLAQNPACTFGRLCECEKFVNAPESSGCDGVYKSSMGDIEVRSVCANYCGCEGGSGTGNEIGTQPDASIPLVGGPSPILGCANTLSQSPACRFGKICECEDFVNAPESEGCGGKYTSSNGDIVVNDVCTQYCNVCEEKSPEELFEEAYIEVITLQFRKNCQYSTAKCKAMLSNMYSCGSSQPGIEVAHPMIRAVVTKQGQAIALASAQLGHPSMHRGEELQEPQACAFESSGENNEDENVKSSGAGGHKDSLWTAMMTIVYASGMFLLWW